MTKIKVLCVSLLLVFGLGLAASSALAQGTLSATTTVYTLRPNSNADAVGPVYLNYVSGTGVVGIGQSFNVLYSQPIVGASGIDSLAVATAQADFCNSVTGASTMSCTNLTVTATGSILTLTNDSGATLSFTGGFLTIYGVRVNTYGLAPSAQVTATVYTSVSSLYPLWTFAGASNVTSTIVGTVSATTAVTAYPNNNTFPGPEGFTYSCLGFPGIPPVLFGGDGNAMFVDVTENWAGAWTSLADELALAPYAPTSSHLVTNGSVISIMVTGIPKGVTVTPQPPGNISGTQTWGTTPAPYTSTADDSSTTFEYALVDTMRPAPPTPITPESAEFDFYLSSSGPLPDQNNPPMTTSVLLDPAPTGSSFYPAFSYPVFGDSEEAPGVPYDIWIFPDCQTTLAFPYVSNYNAGPSAGPLGNWDTAIAVSNMSSIPPTSLYSTIPTNGSCTFSFYQAGTAKTIGTATQATPVTTYTTPVILSGGETAFLLSSAAPGFTGSAYAVCNFLDGTGYAAILDNANGLGNWQLYANYLAIGEPFWDPPAGSTLPAKAAAAKMRAAHK